MTRHKSQGGQAIILVALFLPVLFGVVGLAFDIGFLEMMNRQAQTAADAAAVAGAISLPYSDAAAAAKAAALSNGFPNSSVTVNTPPSIGPNAGKSNFVEVIISQAEPTFFLRMIGAGATTKVAARAVATNLAGDCIFSLSPNAGPSGTVAGNSSCPGCTAALFVGGNSVINVSGCGVQVDSTTAGGLWLEWGIIESNFIGDAASTYWCGLAGSSVTIGPNDWCEDQYLPSPANTYKMYPQASNALSDPLAYLSPPATTCTSGGYYFIFGYPTTSYNITPGSNGVPSCPDVVIAGGGTNVTFNPGTYHSIEMGFAIGPGECLISQSNPDYCLSGTYCESSSNCGWLPCGTANGSSGCVAPLNVTFNSGVYNILGYVPETYTAGGAGASGNSPWYSGEAIGFCMPYWEGWSFAATGSGTYNCAYSVTATGANVTASGATFYMGSAAGGVSSDNCYSNPECSPNNVSFVAPTTGTWAGILFYQDRANSYPACIGDCYGAPGGQSSYLTLSGALYFPDAGLFFSECCFQSGASSTYQITVAKTLNFYYDDFYSNYTSLPGGSPIKKTSLVE